MCTRSQRPSYTIGVSNGHKKKNQPEEPDNQRDDVEMVEEARDYINSFQHLENERKMRKKVKPRKPMPNVMKQQKAKQKPYQKKEVNTQGI